MSQIDTGVIVAQFEEKVHADLLRFLQDAKVVDSHVPECPDVEAKWGEIARAYMPDGVREFGAYPVVSLGWVMFVGMAMAFYWDSDWERYAACDDLYRNIRDLRGYDELDEAVVGNVLGYSGDDAERITDLVAKCASRVYSILNHEHVEPGTQIALGCYVAALHQLYLAGMAVELNALGYHMTRL